MHPGDDPALAARFLGWLQARGEGGPGLAADVARLNELQAWERAEPLLPTEPDAKRLNAVLHRWREFRRELPADWIELAGQPAEGVTWIEPDFDARRAAPEGPAPELVSVRHPRAERRPEPRWLTWTLLTGAALAVGIPASLSEGHAASVQEELAATWEELGSGGRSRRVPPSRPALQLAAASRLIEIRRAQRDAVNGACEGQAWCLSRLAELDRDLRVAVSVRGDAASHPALPAHVSSPVTGHVLPRVVVDEADALLRRLAQPGLSAAERRVAEAELAVLRDAILSAAAPP